MVRYIEYTCDWCMKSKAPEEMADLRINKVYVAKENEEHQMARETELGIDPGEAGRRKTLRARKKTIGSLLDADVCESCVERLKGWIHETGGRVAE